MKIAILIDIIFLCQLQIDFLGLDEQDLPKHRPEVLASDYAQNFNLFEKITPKSARKLGAVGGKFPWKNRIIDPIIFSN